MIRRRHATLLVLGLLAPLALVDAPAGAIDQDLVASAASGPPGTEVTLSSASCTASGDDSEAFLDVQLYSGTEPDLKLAGLGTSVDGAATVTIPDWVDPDQPATFTATCYLYDDETGSEDSLEYDPIAFDVEPGAGTPIQVPTFSRTSLLSGQGTLVSGDGCDPASQPIVIAIPGTDLSGRSSQEESGAVGFGQNDGGSIEAELAMTNTYVSISVGGSSNGDVDIETSETPNTMAPGPYSVFPYCVSEDGSALVLEPSLIELTGTADTSGFDIGLIGPAPGPDLTLGGTCLEGDVVGSLSGEAVDGMAGETIDLDPDAARTLRSAPGAPQVGGDEIRVHTGDRTSPSGTRIDDGEEIEFAFTPDPDSGQWYTEETPTFDTGFVMGFATCGDTLGDGYYYDGQVVDFETEDDVEPTVPPTVPTTVPTPPPADAVSGTPTYAG
ncbi:hypothetical protein ACE2AJ_12510 [Aquihabitans daechungensis]|uniref:hypothetical protein n=1 Tax=Aquihabitans daechungensis TaxID=1052257 RepID=UPI003B9F3AF3